jgi:hypothetical protein
MSQYFAVLPMGRPDGDFNVLPESGEKIHNAFDRKGRGVTSHER